MAECSVNDFVLMGMQGRGADVPLDISLSLLRKAIREINAFQSLSNIFAGGRRRRG